MILPTSLQGLRQNINQRLNISEKIDQVITAPLCKRKCETAKVKPYLSVRFLTGSDGWIKTLKCKGQTIFAVRFPDWLLSLTWKIQECKRKSRKITLRIIIENVRVPWSYEYVTLSWVGPYVVSHLTARYVNWYKSLGCISGIILLMGSANKRRRYIVTSSLLGQPISRVIPGIAGRLTRVLLAILHSHIIIFIFWIWSCHFFRLILYSTIVPVDESGIICIKHIYILALYYRVPAYFSPVWWCGIH